jgi:hypothetical protein
MRGTRMSVAQEHAGVNSNVLTDHEAIDPLSGNAVLNGIPVVLARGDVAGRDEPVSAVPGGGRRIAVS